MTRAHRAPLTLFAFALFAAPALGEEAEPTAPCAPPEELREVLRELGPWTEDCRPRDEECTAEKIARAEGLLEEHPDELHLHRNYQNLLRALPEEAGKERLEAAKARYAERLRQRPGEAEAHYLLGRLTLDRPELERAVELDPAFPWAHLGLAAALMEKDEGEATMEGADAEEAEAARRQAAGAELAAFLELCPERFQETLGWSYQLDDPELWKRWLPGFRRALREAPADERLGYYQGIWRLDFGIHPPTEHDAVRERLRADLEEVEELGLEADEGWWRLLVNGYRMLGAPEKLERLRSEMAGRFPCDLEATKAKLDPWFEEGPLNADGGPEAVARIRELYRASDAWIEECPDDFPLHSTRFHAVGELEDLPVAEIRAEIDRYLEVWESQDDRIRSAPTPYQQAAELLLERRIDLHRVPGLLQREIDRSAEQSGRDLDRLPEKLARRMRRYAAEQEVARHALLAEAHLVLEAAEPARQALEDAAGALERLEDLAGAAEEAEEAEEVEGDGGAVDRSRRARLSRLRGELAELEARPLDAVAFYRRSHRLDPDPEVAERAARLWRGLGGSDEGWGALDAGPAGEGAEVEAGVVVEVAEASGWEAKDEPFPDFQLTDLEGRDWSQADLAGKTVLINFWATWCGPCRLELPHLQKLADRVAEEPGLLVVTFNTDHNVGLVAPFLSEEELSFPVLLAERFVRDRELVTGIPQNWILDREGNVRRTQVGFSPEQAEEWLEDTLAELRELAE